MQIFCAKLKKEGNALTRKPIPGELGEKILNNISQEAWNMWLQQQTMLINENRLAAFEPETQEFLKTQMIRYLFGDEEVSPEKYHPE